MPDQRPLDWEDNLMMRRNGMNLNQFTPNPKTIDVQFIFLSFDKSHFFIGLVSVKNYKLPFLF